MGTLNPPKDTGSDALIHLLKMDDYAGGSLTVGSHTRQSGNYSLVWTVTGNEPVVGSKRVDLTVSWNVTRMSRKMVM